MNTNMLKKIILAGLGVYAQVNGQTRFQNLQYQQTLAKNNALIDLKAQERIKEVNDYVRNLLNIPDIIKGDDLQIRNYDEVFGKIQQVTYDTQANIKKIYREGMSSLLEYEVLNQVGQIFNYEDNDTVGSKQLVGLIANCNMTLKKYNKDSNEITKRLFEQSLDNTVNAFNEENYEDYLKALIVNDKKSFIVTPISSLRHLFSTVVYKNTDVNGDIYFSVVVINKGGRTEELGDIEKVHSKYEQYNISEENMPKVAKMLGYRKNKMSDGEFMPTGKVYEQLRKYSIGETYEELKDITAKEQIVGNCYYKELEAGLKFAFSNAYDQFEIRTKNGKIRKIPKWPTDTMEFQKELVNNIKEIIQEIPFDSEEMARINNHIDKMLSRYIKNKKFRKEIEIEEDISNNKMLKIFIKCFGEQKINDVSQIKDKEVLKELLKDVDFITFNGNNSFFIDILKSTGLEIPQVLEKGIGRRNPTGYIVKKMIKSKQDRETFLEEYLPAVNEAVMHELNDYEDEEQIKEMVSKERKEVSKKQEVQRLPEV